MFNQLNERVSPQFQASSQLDSIIIPIICLFVVRTVLYEAFFELGLLLVLSVFVKGPKQAAASGLAR